MKRAILVGAGPSVNEGIQLGLWEKIRGKDIWSINFAFKTMPYVPSRECFVDVSFFRNNREAIEKLYSQGVKICSKRHSHYASLQNEITQYNCTRESVGWHGKDALLNDPHLFIGRKGLSGTYSLSLAVAEKYDEIFLLGYDFGSSGITDKFTHYYQETTKDIISSGVQHPEIYYMQDGTVNKEVKEWDTFNHNTDSKIWNVSMKSNIQTFPKISYVEFFRKLEEKGINE